WITYRIGEEAFGPHQLVDLTPEDAAREHLSIHSVRGLSLLGMVEGASVTMETGNGAYETITLTRVEKTFKGPLAAGQTGGEVITFRARNQGRPGLPLPPNDDPGPTAA